MFESLCNQVVYNWWKVTGMLNAYFLIFSLTQDQPALALACLLAAAAPRQLEAHPRWVSGKAIEEEETVTKFNGMEDGGEHLQTRRCEFDLTDIVQQMFSSGVDRQAPRANELSISKGFSWLANFFWGG